MSVYFKGKSAQSTVPPYVIMCMGQSETAGTTFLYGGAGVPPTEAFYVAKEWAAQFCFAVSEQEFLSQTKPQPGSENQGQDEAELLIAIMAKLANLSNTNQQIKTMLEGLSTETRNRLLPSFGGITDAITEAIMKFSHT